MQRIPTPTIFLTGEEDSRLYDIALELGMTRTEFIYQAILEKIDDHERNINHGTDTDND